MPVILQVTSGPLAGKRIYVARGQVAKVGRTEFADFSLPHDATLADVHFAIDATGAKCLFRDLSGGAATLINGQPVTEGTLHTGDSVTAGQTTFSVVVDGEVPSNRDSAGADFQATADNPPDVEAAQSPPQAADFCRMLKMSDPAKQLLQEGMKRVDYLNLLTKQELYPDALRFLAFWLPKPVAITWGCDCILQVCGKQLGSADQDALTAARAWAKDPNETNRRAAEAAANVTQFSGAASWLALGAFWSGGSLSEPDLPAVPPDEALTAEAITGALMLGATQEEPLMAQQRYQDFLDRGRRLLLEIDASTANSEVQ